MDLEKIFNNSVESYFLAEYIVKQIKKGKNLTDNDLILMILDFYFEYIWVSKRRRNLYPEPPLICFADTKREIYIPERNIFSINHHNFLKKIDTYIKNCKFYSYAEEIQVKNELKKAYNYFVPNWRYHDKHCLTGGFYSLYTIDDFYRLFILEIVGVKIQEPELEKYWSYYTKTLQCPLIVFINYANKCFLLKGNKENEFFEQRFNL